MDPLRVTAHPSQGPARPAQAFRGRRGPAPWGAAWVSPHLLTLLPLSVPSCSAPKPTSVAVDLVQCEQHPPSAVKGDPAFGREAGGSLPERCRVFHQGNPARPSLHRAPSGAALHQAFTRLLAVPPSHFLPSDLASELPSSLSLPTDSSEISRTKGCSGGLWRGEEQSPCRDHQHSHGPHLAAPPSPAQQEDAAGHSSNT